MYIVLMTNINDVYLLLCSVYMRRPNRAPTGFSIGFVHS